jgi:peptidoglycan/xylan/chitin deacetylase (PgdA/CDA1 family)
MLLYFVMTIDVDPPISSIPEFMISKGVASLLDLFDKHTIKATFFVPSMVAEKFPASMKEIVKRRHEIACHGLKHDPWEATLNVDKQTKMIKAATDSIQSITGLRPVGFRAPLFRINENCWKALQKNGYLYDSSIVCSPFYGSHKIFLPTKPFFLPTPEKSGSCSLLEIPVSTNPFLPFPLGGFWLRLFGLIWTKIGVTLNFISRTPVVFYIHPKDVVPREYGRRWYYYYNTTNCMNMLNELIEYAKQSGAKFLKAYELANLSSRLINPNDN